MVSPVASRIALTFTLIPLRSFGRGSVVFSGFVRACSGGFSLGEGGLKLSIVNSQITENALQAHDGRYVREVHTDHLGQEYHFTYAAVGSADINAIMLARVPSIEQTLIDSEIENWIGKVEDGNIVALDVSPEHRETDTVTIRKRRFARRLIRYAMVHNNLKTIRRIMYPIWYYLKFDSGYTAQQIANYLNVSLSKLSNINARFQAIHDNLSFIDADNAMIGEVD